MQRLVCFILIIGINCVAADRNFCGKNATDKDNWPGNEKLCDYDKFPVIESMEMPRNSTAFSFAQSLDPTDRQGFLEVNQKTPYSGCGCNDGYWRDWDRKCVLPIDCYSKGLPPIPANRNYLVRQREKAIRDNNNSMEVYFPGQKPKTVNRSQKPKKLSVIFCRKSHFL